MIEFHDASLLDSSIDIQSTWKDRKSHLITKEQNIQTNRIDYISKDSQSYSINAIGVSLKQVK
jgi:hypothetical protein